MPSITSCSVTPSRKDAICSPSASQSPCVRQRWPAMHGLSASPPQRVMRMSSSTAAMTSDTLMALAGRPRR